MKKLAPALLAIALLAFFLGRESWRPNPPAPPKSGGPEDGVRAMFDAAREGRIADYLEAFCDPLRASLADTARAMGDARFREYIKNAAVPIMGMAFSEIVQRDPSEATLRCELVFKDRNEVQRFTLKKAGRRWRIAAMTAAESFKPPVPYGTKVFE